MSSCRACSISETPSGGGAGFVRAGVAASAAAISGSRFILSLQKRDDQLVGLCISPDAVKYASRQPSPVSARNSPSDELN